MRIKNAILAAAVTAAALPQLPADAGTTLQTCGYQNLSIVMEQVSTSSWAYDENNDGMWLWNEYMDVYRYTADDGSWGRNNDNEFGGFPSSASYNSVWGFTWDATDLAATAYTWNSQCARIQESDIIFNPNKTWTTSRSGAEYSSSIYYPSVLLHELGHAWGMQTSTFETYNYDHPTVMHAYVSSVVQDYLQIHKSDAYLIRRLYDDELSTPSMRDMGVLSKYADSTWIKATTDRSSYFAGGDIDISGMTVENTGTLDLTDVRLRIYLSTNRTISTSDTLIGEWYWDDFDSETYWTGDLEDHEIPDGLCGTYYVGALVTRSGYVDDDLSWNDSIYLIDPINIVCFTASPMSHVLVFNAGLPLASSSYAPLLQQLLEEDLVHNIIPVQEAHQFAEQLANPLVDLVIAGERPGGHSDVYEHALVDYLRRGGRAIISDPRADDPGAQRILRAAGVRFADSEQPGALRALGLLGDSVLPPIEEDFTVGLHAEEGSSVYARFAGGDAAIAGIPGRTFVNGFVDGSIPGGSPVVMSLLRSQFDSLLAGRGQPQAHARYSLMPASWTLDGNGNVQQVELHPERAFVEVSEAGGELGYAVLVDVESTDAEGLRRGQFDITASDEAVQFSPLNLGVRYRDPDSKLVNVQGQPTPLPAVRPLVDQSPAVNDLFNSVFTGVWSEGTPEPGALNGVLLSQSAQGPVQRITRGIGQLGNNLGEGPTILGVGTVTIPPGTERIDLQVVPGEAQVYGLDPTPGSGDELPTFAGEMIAGLGLQVVRPPLDIPAGEEAVQIDEALADEDCNGNGVADGWDIGSGSSSNCNLNGVPDECDIEGGESADCNGNLLPDACDIADGISTDGNGDGIPDECTACSDTLRPKIVHGAGLAGQTRPFSGYIDPRAESSNGTDFDLGVQRITLEFSETVFDGGPSSTDLTPAAFELRQSNGASAPAVVAVTRSDPTTVEIELDRPLTPQTWTTIVAHVQDACGNAILTSGDLGPAVLEADRVDVGFLPGDTDQNNAVTPVDLLRFRQMLAGTHTPSAGQVLDYIDINRDGASTPLDLLRYRQLLLGTGYATQAWAGEVLGPRP